VEGALHLLRRMYIRKGKYLIHISNEVKRQIQMGLLTVNNIYYIYVYIYK